MLGLYQTCTTKLPIQTTYDADVTQLHSVCKLHVHSRTCEALKRVRVILYVEKAPVVWKVNDAATAAHTEHAHACTSLSPCCTTFEHNPEAACIRVNVHRQHNHNYDRREWSTQQFNSYSRTSQSPIVYVMCIDSHKHVERCTRTGKRICTATEKLRSPHCGCERNVSAYIVLAPAEWFQCIDNIMTDTIVSAGTTASEDKGPDSDTAAVEKAVRHRKGLVNYPNRFIDHDLTERQRWLVTISVFMTAILVIYFTGIRPGE